MTNTAKAWCWGILGPLASIFLGYAAFFCFAFILGPGIDIDHHATAMQGFFGALAFPALVGIPGIGVFLSLWRAWYWFRLR
jgi:hypothetical protein